MFNVHNSYYVKISVLYLPCQTSILSFMKLKDILYDSFDGDSKYIHLTREQLLDMDISIQSIRETFPIVGSFYRSDIHFLTIYL